MNINNTTLYIPKDLLSLCGQFEKEILEAEDCRVTNLAHPFGVDHARVSFGQWIYSDSVGKAFFFDNKRRMITEYETAPANWYTQK